MKISVLGCGRWGSFIAWYLDSIGHDTLLWGRESSSNFKRIKETHKNDTITFIDNGFFSFLTLTFSSPVINIWFTKSPHIYSFTIIS